MSSGEGENLVSEVTSLEDLKYYSLYFTGECFLMKRDSFINDLIKIFHDISILWCIRAIPAFITVG